MRWLRRFHPAATERIRPIAEPMEPRLLYSADLTGGLLLGADVAAGVEQRTLTAEGEYAQIAATTAATTPSSTKTETYALLPLAFEQNEGQAAPGVDFIAQGSGYGIALDGGNALLTFATPSGQRTVGLELVGASSAIQAEGENRLPGQSNYILGNDASRWITGIDNYGAVAYRGVYEGIDVRYYGNQRQLEYDFIVAPGADTDAIQLRFTGVESITIADNGDLLLRVQGTDSEVRFKAPVSYQRGEAGLEAVASRYVIRGDGSVGFELGAYDTTRELVIDPVLDYATYLGASGTDAALAVAVDANGHVYVTGRTTSSGAPFGGSLEGEGDIFVAKLRPDLSGFEWVTRVGGAADEQGNAIAVDSNGNVAVTGWTKSDDFPTVNADDSSLAGTILSPRQDAVVFKLDAEGDDLVFSTYFGGSDDTDSGNAVAFDGSGSVYAAGRASAGGLFVPILSPLLGSSDNAFVNKYSSSGARIYQQLLGGTETDYATGIAVGAAGDVYVVGATESAGIALGSDDNVMSGPGTISGPQTSLDGATDGFLVHLDPTGNTALYATYVGGSDADTASAVAVDGAGKAYVVGVSRWGSSVDFTTTTGAYMTSGVGSTHDTGFLRVYDTNVAGTGSLVYSTYLGGSGVDRPTGVALAGSRVVVTGLAGSTTDFPITAGAAQSTNPGGAMFVLVINPLGTSASDLMHGTFYAANASAGGVAINGNHAVIAGGSTSAGYGTGGTAQPNKSGNGDALVASFTLPNTAPVLNGVVQPGAILEDSGGDNGFLVSSLLLGQVLDLDAGAVQGIAITGSDTASGTWEFSLDGSNWNAVSAPSITSALLLAADGQSRIRFVPAANFSGTVNAGLTLRAWDRTSGTAGGRADTTTSGGTSAFSSASRAVNITVTAVNDAPIGVDDTLAATEDTPVTYTAADLVGNDTDVDGPALSIDSVTSGPGGTAVLNADGTVTFTPDANFNGGASFTYTVTDGTATSGPTTATITVAAVNDAPVAVNDAGTTLVNTPVTFGAGSLTGNDTDVENSPLTIASVTSGSGGSAVLNGDGSVTFTPDTNFAGNATFTYTVFDGTTTSAPATVTVDVNARPVAVADALLATEDVSITYAAAALLANDSDADGDSLAIASVTSGSNGTAVLNADGTVTFTPNANFNGTANFTYTITDGLATSAAATATVTVAAVNDAPIARNDTAITAEDNILDILHPVLLGNDSDVEGSALAINSVTAVSGGSVAIVGTLVRFTPTPNFHGTASFTYAVTDGTLTSAPATVTITVTPANDAPVAVDDTVNAVEDTAATYTAAQLLGNDIDPDSATLTIVSVGSATNGTVVLNADGTVTFTPDPDFFGEALFKYTVSDGTLNSQQQGRVRVNVISSDDVPVGVADTLAATEDVPVTYAAADLLGNDRNSDAPLNTLSIVSVTSGAGGTAVLNADGTVSFTPNANFNGTASFTYTLTDGLTTTGAVNVSVVVAAVNDAPTVNGTVTLPAMLEDGGTVTITASNLLANASDIDSPATSLTVAGLAASSGSLVDNLDGTWSYTPAVNFNGTVTFTYRVSDGTASSALTSATLHVVPVNDAPVAVADNVTATEDVPRTYTAAELTGNDTDVEGSTLGIASVGDAVNGNVVLNADGSVTFTANPNFNGTASFTYTVGDGASTSGPATVTIDVAAVNDAPTVSGPVTLPAMLEDDPGSPVTITAAALLANASDVDLPPDTLTVIGLAASTGSLVDNLDGTWSYTAPADFNGTVTFSYRVSDGRASSALTSATLEVDPVNDAPTVTGPVTLPSMLEDGGTVTITASDLLIHASDIDSPPASLAVVGLTASRGSLVDNLDGTWSYTPVADFNGLATFTYRVSDGVASSAVTSATLQVDPVNDAPTTSNVVLAPLDEDGTRIITQAQLLANASDVEGSVLTVSSLVASSGTLTDLGGGNWSFTPDADDDAAVTFAYQISDGTATVAGTASLALTPVNDAPVAMNDVRVATEDTAASYSAAELLGNDTDVDGDSLVIASVTSGPGGTAVLNADGTVTFTPDSNFNGVATFTYTVSDGTKTSAAAAVTVTVAAVNDAPQANDDALAAVEDTSITFTAAQLVGNDSDVDSGSLTIASVTSGAGGTAVLNADGTVTFTPDADFNGAASFQYTVTDRAAASNAATVSVQVASVEDAPVITSGGGAAVATSISENTTSVGVVTATDVDLPRQALVFSIAGGADASRFVVDPATGALAFAASPDFESRADADGDNVYEVVVQVSDGVLSDRQSLSITVLDAPEEAPPPPFVPAPAPAPAPSAESPAAPAPIPAAAPAPGTPSAPASAATPSAPGRTADMGSELLTTPDSAIGAAATPSGFEVGSIGIRAPDASHVRMFQTVVFDRTGFDLVATQAPADLLLSRFGAQAAGEGSRLEDLQRSLRSAAFASELDRLRQSVREDLDLDKSVSISVASVSLGLSLVYVLWLIRGGVLLGSYLSALPAWRILDPLPVLSRVEDEEDDEDGDPFEDAGNEARNSLRGFG